MAGKPTDLSGRRYHELVVLRRVTPPGEEVKYLCRCDCGNEKVIRAANLRNNSTLSCGCRKAKTLNGYKHGLCSHPLNRLWRCIKERCSNPNSKSYRWYGAKGVRMCESWAASFASFYDWATSNGYRKGVLIDRIDPEGGYSPENCRFVNAQESAQNRSGIKLNATKVKAIRIAVTTKIMSVEEVAKFFGIHKETVKRVLQGKTWGNVWPLTQN